MSSNADPSGSKTASMRSTSSLNSMVNAPVNSSIILKTLQCLNQTVFLSSQKNNTTEWKQ